MAEIEGSGRVRVPRSSVMRSSIIGSILGIEAGDCNGVEAVDGRGGGG